MNAQVREQADKSVRQAKRSSNVRLTTMVAVAGSVLTAACGGDDAPANTVLAATGPQKGEQQVDVYDNVFDCVKKSGMTQPQCADAYSEAAANAEKEAPKFAALYDCEQEFGAGKCAEETGVGGRRSFFPFIAGFVYGQLAGSGGAARATPLFSKPGSGLQTANGARLGYAGAPGKYYAAARAMEKPKAVPKVTAASPAAAKVAGFGNRAGSGFALADRDGGSSDSKSRLASRGG